MLTSCHTSKSATSPPTPPPVVLNNNDSVSTETIIKTVYVPVEVDVELPQQSVTNLATPDSSHLETDLAISDAWLNPDGTLGHLLENKPGTIKGNAYVPETSTESNKEEIRTKEIPVPQPYPVEVEREFTLMEQIKLASFWYLVGAIAVSIIYLLRKPLLRVLRKIV